MINFIAGFVFGVFAGALAVALTVRHHVKKVRGSAKAENEISAF